MVVVESKKKQKAQKLDVVEAEHHHEHEDVLNVLRRRLRTSDAIMEHDILNTLKLFIANGGSPEARRVVVAVHVR